MPPNKLASSCENSSLLLALDSGVLLKICSFLTPPDLALLRLTCRALREEAGAVITKVLLEPYDFVMAPRVTRSAAASSSRATSCAYGSPVGIQHPQQNHTYASSFQQHCQQQAGSQPPPAPPHLLPSPAFRALPDAFRSTAAVRLRLNADAPARLSKERLQELLTVLCRSTPTLHDLDLRLREADGSACCAQV